MKTLSLFSGKLKISPWLCAVVVICAAVGKLEILLAFFAALALHEGAHALLAGALMMTIRCITVMPFGCAAEFEGFDSLQKEAVVAAAGPCANVAAAGAAVLFLAPDTAFGQFFVAGNIALAAVNCLPALPLDGGRILKCVLSMFLEIKTAEKILCIAGIVFGCGMAVCFAVLMHQGEVNITLLIMGGFLIAYAVAQLKNRAFLRQKKLMEKRSLLHHNRVVRAAHVVAGESTPVLQVLGALDYSKWNFVSIAARDGRILKTVTERELFEFADRNIRGNMRELTFGAKSDKINKNINGTQKIVFHDLCGGKTDRPQYRRPN